MHIARRATPEDSKRIAEVQVQGWKAAYRGIIPDDYLDAMEPEGRRLFWDQQVRDECGDLFVAAADGVVTGFCHLIPSRDADGEGTSEVAAVYVDPGAWRQGCGRSLCEAALKSAFLHGSQWVTLWVLADNRLGRQFYEAMGFLADGATKSEDCRGFALEEVRYRINPRRREQIVAHQPA